ncbi:MAG: hypothetical protein CMO74_04195 [Verrucomicrobiales bacterium]|nr:hypothetical protein [Verrucomicrobiales bacterium]|tara:strand:+ start:145 stop:399 length:255 start_codon:yes stop_codon:yes gene_type:complete
MKSRAVSSFWKQYRSLPPDLHARAAKQYRLWLANPDHPSLRFKKVGRYWSARISDNYRAVGVMDGDTVVWFFIGPHTEYEKLLR